MATRRSLANERDLRAFGESVARWRKVLGLTAEVTAERAGITRATLRSIERGDGTARLENVFMVLRVLHLTESVLAATDPLSTEVGRLRLSELLPQRVRVTGFDA